MTEPPAGTPNGDVRRGITSIRGQLVWAAIFPLAAFGLIMVLVITAALTNSAQKLILQRNTAMAQVVADRPLLP